jgi:hypothetical protein
MGGNTRGTTKCWPSIRSTVAANALFCYKRDMTQPKGGAAMSQAKKPKAKSDTGNPKCSCGSPIDLSGQCTNPKCKKEHTTINAMPPDGLSWNEYKDFYG